MNMSSPIQGLFVRSGRRRQPSPMVSSASAGGSTSMVSAEAAATGWHVFKVQGYSKYKATAGLGTAVTSGEFSVGGHRWRILYFPCGCTGKENSGCVCFGLHLVVPPAAAADAAGDGGGDCAVKAKFKLSLLDKDGAPLPRPYTRVSRLLDLSIANNEWHLKQFITNWDFDRFYLKTDCFSVRCDVTVVDESVVLPSPGLHRHLGNLLATGVGGDVTFQVGKETFVAHRNVLAARSPVFMAEFFGGMMEEKAAAAHVRIIGIDARVFEDMLHFIYTDSMPEIEEGDETPMAQHLLVAADRYGIERLKLICENKLCVSVNASVVATTLVLAEQHGCRRLKDACFKFLRFPDNFKAMGYDDYNYLKRSCPSLVDELQLIAEHGL